MNHGLFRSIFPFVPIYLKFFCCLSGFDYQSDSIFARLPFLTQVVVFLFLGFFLVLGVLCDLFFCILIILSIMLGESESYLNILMGSHSVLV